MIKEKLLLVADRLYSFRAVFLLSAACFTGGIIYCFIFIPAIEQNQFVMPSFLALLWSLMLYTLLVFTQNKPQYANEKLSLINNIKFKIKRFIYSLFTVVFLVLTLAVVIVTFRLFIVWLQI